MKTHTLVHVCLISAMLLSGLTWLPSAAGAPVTDLAPAGTLAGVRYVKPGGTGNCSSWAAACDLQTALAGAGEGDEIWVADGVHYPGPAGAPRTATFQLKSRVGVYGGFEGTEASRFLRKPGANLTILSGDLDRNGLLDDGNAFHVVTGSGVDGSAILDGFIITSGHAYSDDHTDHPSGGGMFNVDSSPTLSNLTFSGNKAVTGSGMFNSNSQPVLTNVAFTSNTEAQAGGGMLNVNSSPTLINVTFFANSAAWGGGMYNVNSSLRLTNVTIYANTASEAGGGIFTEGGSLTLANSILWGNTAEASAQIYASSATVTYSIIQGGYAGAGNLAEYPEFVDPENGNLRLRINSPAIDAGNNAALPAGVVTDLDGSPRFVDMPGVDDRGLGNAPVVDIGAYEAQTIAPVLYVDRDAPGPIHDGKSWEQAFPRLESALAAASLLNVILASEGDSRPASPISSPGTELHAAVNGPQIWVAGGVYYPGLPGDRWATFRLESGVAVYGGFSGVETALEQRSWRANPTTLSGDIDRNGILDDGNAFHVVTGAGLAGSTLLDGFTITAGNANGLEWGTDVGGGMYNYNASSPTLNNLSFSSNTAGIGGGMANTEASSPTLTNVGFYENMATYGGGMANQAASSPTLTGVTFVANTANADGGGMFNERSSPTLTKVAFFANSAGYSGGGMYNLDRSSPTLTNTGFTCNSADSGGGVSNVLYSHPTLTNVSFTFNTADMGGGVINLAGSSPTLTNALFYVNSATIGGGMANFDDSISRLTNVTFYANRAESGGGIFNNHGSRPTLTNAILWGNTASAGEQIFDEAANPNPVSFSIVQGGYPGYVDPGTFDEKSLFANPDRGDLRLRHGSPAIDAGNNHAVPAGVLTDLAGKPRFVDIPGVVDSGLGAPPLVDMGAYEFHFPGIYLPALVK